MRLTFTLLLGLMCSFAVQAQTLLYSENFETNTLPDSVTMAGTGTRGTSTTLFSQGLRSDSMRIAVSGDSVVMTTDAFSTTGNSFVMLHFDHICKIEFFDEGYIEVSNDNGATWVRLTGTQYQGLSQFTTQGNKFTAAAYATDWAAGVYAVPSNAWWKSETFDISLLVSNAPSVKLRFVLRDAQPGNTMPDNYAWFIDNIRVLGAFSELNPPVLTMLPPIVQDTVYSTGPYLVRSHITDQSLVDTAYLVYWVNVGTPDTIGMTKMLADTFQAAIPFFGFGKNIHYYVVAIDGSAAHNTTNSTTYHFYCKFSTGGTYTLGTGTTVNTATGYPTPYGNYYYGSKEQYLIQASEMLALGMPGGPISSLAFNVSNVNACPGLTGFYIMMTHTTTTALSAFITSGFTTVYNNASYQPVVGWNTHTFQTPFVWNGSDNVLIEVCFNNTSYPSNGNASVYQSATTYNSLLNFHTDNATVCSVPGTPTTYMTRPNMKIEILGVTSLTLDASVGQIVYPTGGVIANTPFAVTAKVKNHGTDTLLSATVNWKLDGVLQTPYPWTGSLLKDSLSPIITLGTISLPMGVHHIVAWTDNPNGSPDLNTGNDSSSISFMACANLLSGTYTIGGTNPDFATFSAAVIALDQCGINAPVVFNVAPGIYNEQLVIPWISGTSAINTVTFQSATPDSTLVTLAYTASGASSNYLLKLDGTQYITFKNIKFLPGSNTFATAVQLSNGSNLNAFKGNLFVGAQGTTDDLILFKSDHLNNTNNLIQGNRFDNASTSIYIKGTNSTNTVSGVNILGNVLEGFTNAGIKAEFVQALIIDGNKLYSAVTNSGTKHGLQLLYAMDTIKVTRNQIVLEGSTNTNGIYLENCTSAVEREGLIANNFISILNGTNLTYGMRILTSSRWKIYHNSMYITGNSANDTRGINTVSTSNGMQVLNNNIYSNKYPSFYEGSSCSRSNYNNLYSSGNMYGYYTTSTLSFPTLAAYKLSALKDTNSVSYIPYFASNINLHTFNGLLNGIATPVPEVTIDIDGELRNILTPDIGADEFEPPAIDVTVLGFTNPTGGCAKTTTEPVTILIKNVGTDTVTSGLNGHFRFNNSATVISESISATILPGDTLAYTFTATVDMNVFAFGGIDSTFALEAWTTLIGDYVAFNDTTKTTVLSRFTPAAPAVVTPVSVAYGGQANLSATSSQMISWYLSDTATVSVDTGATYTTPYLYSPTNYYAAASASAFTGGLSAFTTMAAGNSFLGNMFDITPNTSITIDSFDVNIVAGAGTIEVYYRPGTYIGFTGSSAGWVLAGTASVNGQGTGIPTRVPIGGLTLQPGQTYGLYITLTAGTMYYTNITQGLIQTEPDFTMAFGYGGGYFALTNSGRQWNGRIYYSKGAIGCPSSKAQIQINVGTPPPVDAGIVAITNPSQFAVSGMPQEIKVKLKNFGLDTLQQAMIYYNVNSVLKDSMLWTGSLLHDSTEIVTIDTATFAGGTYCIKAWTYLPNGVADTVTTNDADSSCFNACMSGIFTIGPASSGTYDYNTFNSALNALITSGICGHVIFDVYPGTYSEQVSINQITGMNANNTVTFRGATGDSTLAILQYTAAGSADYWTLRLNGADWFRFEKITIKGLGTTYARAVEFTLGSDDNMFSNCVIQVPVGSASYFVPIYKTTASTGHRNTFYNNRILNGYYGVYYQGVSSAVGSLQKGTIFKGNLFEGQYYYGAYIYYQDSLIFTENTIRNLSNFANGYGLYAGYCQNFSQFTKNKVELAPTGVMYGGLYIYYCTGTATSRGLVANNFVSVTGTSTAGAHQGIRVYYSNYVDVLYNSINITTGPATAHALDFYYGTMNNSLNNYARISGSGYALYVTTGASLDQSDYNNYFGTASSTLFWGANYSTLTAMQAVSLKDAHSHMLNVNYLTPTDLHLLSTNLSAKGITNPRVSDDIDGEPRAAIPTIGADEVPLIPTDAGVIAIVTPGTPLNEGQLYPVEVTVINYGTDTIFSMNVQYTVNNGTPVTALFSDTLVSLQQKNLIMPSMTSPAGNSVICAKTLLVGDTNLFNDQYCKNFFGTPLYDAQLFKITGLETGCGIGLDTVSVWVRNLGVNAINSPAPSTVTVSYKIKPTLPAVTEAFTPVVLPGDSVLFHFTTFANFGVTTVDDTFNVKAWVDLLGDNVRYNDTAITSLISMHTPVPPVVVDTIIPYGTQVTIHAQSPDSVKWYASDTASVELGSGQYFTTPVLYTNTTYWAAANSGSYSSAGPYNPGPNIAPQAVASASNCSTGPCSSFNDLNFGTCGTQQVWISTGTPPTSTPHVDFIDFVWPADVTVDGMTIHHAQNSARFLTGATMYKWVAGAWVSFHTFSNLPMQCINTFQFPRVTTTKLRLTSFQMTGTGQLSNPNFREIEVFEAKAMGCSSTRAPLLVTVANQQPCDVGVFQIVQPVSAVNLGTQETVKVKVRNFGSASQTNIPVSFQIDNLPPVTETITATLLFNDSLEYTFVAKANLAIVGNTYQMKAWTGITCDSTHQNDTTWKTVMNMFPSYCPSNATSPSYEDMTNVTLHTLNNTSPAVGSQYTNFTATVAPPLLSPGISYPISISSGFPPGYSYQYACWVKAYIDFNRDGTLDGVTEMVFSSAMTSSSTITGTVLIPPTAMSGNTLLRVVFVETSSATGVNPCGTYSWGETEDYMITITPQGACDAGITSIVEPGGTTLSGTSLPVKVVVMNFGSDPIAPGALSLSVVFNNGTPVIIPYTPGLASMGVDTLTLPNITANMGYNTLCVKTILACDTITFNDEKCRTVFGLLYTTIPYFDDFEGQNVWYKPDISTNWQYGTPSASIINSAYSGSKAWATNLTGNYGDNANEYIYSPIFDFTALGATDTVTLSFYHWMDVAAADYGKVQYTFDGGANWANLGFYQDPLGTNWYNTQVGGVHYFSLPNTGWMQSAYKLTPAMFNIHSEVQFRFHFYSTASGNANGWAIDNVKLGLPMMPNDVGVTAINYPLNDTATGSVVNAKVTITNYGSNVQTMFPVLLKLNGVTVATETWSGTLPSLGTTSYTFVLPFTVPASQYQICAETQLTGDAFPVNDGNCGNFSPLPAYHDAGIGVILAPMPDSVGQICFYHQQAQPWYMYDVVVRLRNYGQNAQTSIPLKYTFSNGGTVHTDSWTGNLATNDSVDITLNTQFLPALGAQQLCVETDLVGDPVSTNNKTCKSYTGVACIGISDPDATGFVLGQNIPNPASGTALIGYTVPQAGEVVFGLVSPLGQLLQRQTSTVQAGQHQIELEVTSLAQGVYYYYVEFNGQRLTRKMVVSH